MLPVIIVLLTLFISQIIDQNIINIKSCQWDSSSDMGLLP